MTRVPLDLQVLDSIAWPIALTLLIGCGTPPADLEGTVPAGRERATIEQDQTGSDEDVVLELSSLAPELGLADDQMRRKGVDPIRS